jgi:hypothetical protein
MRLRNGSDMPGRLVDEASRLVGHVQSLVDEASRRVGYAR